MPELRDVKGRVINLYAIVHGATFVIEDEQSHSTRSTVGLGIVVAFANQLVKVYWRAWHGPRIVRWEEPSSIRVMADRTLEELLVHQEAEIRELALKILNTKK